VLTFTWVSGETREETEQVERPAVSLFLVSLAEYVIVGSVFFSEDKE
jgi:hypothetical protein